ncbi:MAG: hypothetical protein GTN64_08130 [Candidatus Latescibacteria bacterium]|nr:hypothetical protein [Candidatus Latescibacterota bacterium]NIO78570.1 hypothetical protein [Candidatus Latescibacterota bacterium]
MTDLIASALTTLPAVKEYLSITASKDDREFKHLINVVSRDCQEYCGREFLKATYTDEKYDGKGTSTLNLRNYPIIQVTKLVGYRDGIELIEGDHFEVYAARGQIVLLGDNKFPISVLGITITYDAGYDGIPNLPEELKFSIDMAVAHLYNEQNKETYNVRRQQKGQFGFAEYIETIYPKRVLVIWGRYSRKRFG